MSINKDKLRKDQHCDGCHISFTIAIVWERAVKVGDAAGAQRLDGVCEEIMRNRVDCRRCNAAALILPSFQRLFSLNVVI